MTKPGRDLRGAAGIQEKLIRKLSEAVEDMGGTDELLEQLYEEDVTASDEIRRKVAALLMCKHLYLDVTVHEVPAVHRSQGIARILEDCRIRLPLDGGYRQFLEQELVNFESIRRPRVWDPLWLGFSGGYQLLRVDIDSERGKLQGLLNILHVLPVSNLDLLHFLAADQDKWLRYVGHTLLAMGYGDPCCATVSTARMRVEFLGTLLVRKGTVLLVYNTGYLGMINPALGDSIARHKIQ